MRIVAVLSLAMPLAFAADQYPAPRFTDPSRRVKLEAALPDVDRIFTKALQNSGAPGFGYGVVIDGEVVFAKGIGFADRTSQRPVTPDTVFRIASMTKSFTALCILKLRDDGKLSLDDPVAKWIPEIANWKYPAGDSGPLRIRHLLTHGGGFPEDNPWGDRQLATSDGTMGRWLKAGLPFSTPPGTSFEYSNYGFAILGRVIAKVSGAPYAEYVQKAILDPLGMKASGLEVARFAADRLALGYRKHEGEYVLEPSLAHGAFGSMGGMHTSARDLGRYVAFLLSAFPPRDGEDARPVRRASVREMQQPWRPSSLVSLRNSLDGPLGVRDFSYGYGLAVRRDCDGETRVSHAGGLPGFGSYMAWWPEYGVGLFAMANLTYAAPSQAVMDSLQALRKTGALRPRELPPSTALLGARDVITRLWEGWSDRELAASSADNLLLDSTAAERRSTVEKIKTELGPCRPSGDIKVENWLRGSFEMACGRGHVNVSFTLAPTVPPKIQYLAFEPVPSLSAELRRAAEALIASVNTSRSEDLSGMAAPSLDRSSLDRELGAMRVLYRSCKMGAVVSGDGRRNATIGLDCERGAVNMQLRLDDNGKLAEAGFGAPARAGICSQ